MLLTTFQGFSQPRLLNRRSAESGSLQVGFVEKRSLQVGFVEKRSLQVRLVEVRPLQMRLAQVGFPQVSFTEVSFLQTSPGEECSIQVRTGEVGFLEMRFAQRRFFQVCPDEHSLFQVRLAQISSRQQNYCGSALFFSGLIPLLAGEVTAQTRQWKGMQIHITQIRTPQVQPLAILLLVAGRCRTASVLVCCQEPLDIGTTQFHSLEGIDASRDIWGRRKITAQLFLALLPNLGFSTPGCQVGLPCCTVQSRGSEDTLSR